MLVLTRKSNQSIMIGDNIEVSVLAIMGEKVRIGIQADRTVPVFRKEVYLEIQAEQNGDAPASDRARTDSDRERGRGDGNGERGRGSNGEARDPDGRSKVDAALRSLEKSR